MVFATDSEVATFYVEKLTKRCGGYGISVWQKVKVYIQGLKNKNNSYISKPLKTQPWKSYGNEGPSYLGALKSAPGKYFSKSAVCVIGIEDHCSCKHILTDSFEMKLLCMLPIVNKALLFDHKIR